MTMAQHIADGIMFIEHELCTVGSEDGHDTFETRDFDVDPVNYSAMRDGLATILADWVAEHADALDSLTDRELRDLGEDMQLQRYGGDVHERWPDFEGVIETFPEVLSDTWLDGGTVLFEINCVWG